jgi:hypothetical protein
MAAVQEREHGFASRADFLQRAANAKVAARGHQSFFKRFNCFLRPAALLVNLREIQIELGVIVPHPKGFLAQRFSVTEALFGNGCKESRIGEIERVFGSYAQSATGMKKGFVGISITQVL